MNEFAGRRTGARDFTGPQRGSLTQRSPLSLALASIARLVPLRWRLGAGVAIGTVACAGIAYATAQNADAAPDHLAALLRVAIIGTLITAGLYAQTSRVQARMGVLLVAAGLFSALWLLNGSSQPFLFSVGLACAGLAPTVFYYLLLAHPTGLLRSPSERWAMAVPAAALGLGWAFLILTSPQPLSTPLVHCRPHCPTNAFYLGSVGGAWLARAVVLSAWTAMTALTALLMYRRWRQASPPLRRALLPVELAAGVAMVLWLAYLLFLAGGWHGSAGVGAAYVSMAVVVPVAILVGLGLERMFMGRALADFTTALVHGPNPDPEPLLGRALGDPSLRIAYQRPAQGTYVDAAGVVVPPPSSTDPTRAVAWIEREGRPIAAVDYAATLSDQQGLVEAAATIAMMHLEVAQLKGDLKASTRELAASRIRLVEAADAERRRIERDLHDGVQQQLLGLRIKLDLAGETIPERPADGRQMMSAIGRQMDDLLDLLRSFARGIYPALLTERGIGEALRSAARRSPVPVEVRTADIVRYREDTEVAVYFCCFEAMQNIVKHAGSEVQATVRLWQDGQWLRFEVLDTGRGFDSGEVSKSLGLVNMRDRIEAVGGSLTVSSRPGLGTSVRGSVPIA